MHSVERPHGGDRFSQGEIIPANPAGPEEGE
jgi:hypothetical protein